MSIQSETFSNSATSDIDLRGNLLSRIVFSNRVLFGLVLLHLAIGLAISVILSVPFGSKTVSLLFRMLSGVLPLFLICLILWRFSHMSWRVRPEKPVQWLAADLKNILFDTQRMFTGIALYLAMIIFIGTFASLKQSIPLMIPYSWDPAFASLDRMLHGGYDAYVLIMPLLGTAALTSFANSAYVIWFLLHYFSIIITCFDKDNAQRRNTFLISFVLVWALGGNFLATVFASGGPAFYQAFGYGDHFVPLTNFLNEIAAQTPLSALDLQAMLLDGYLNDQPIKGISAMPSMHLASAWIMTFLAFQYHRALGWIMVVFSLIIQLASVHLAWHYAIDGYFGFIIAASCWWIAKKLAHWQANSTYA